MRGVIHHDIQLNNNPEGPILDMLGCLSVSTKDIPAPSRIGKSIGHSTIRPVKWKYFRKDTQPEIASS